MKTFPFISPQSKTLFSMFFYLFLIFPLGLDAQSLILFEDLKTSSFTEVSPSVFTFYKLSNVAIELTNNESTSSLFKINPAMIAIISNCNGQSLIGGYQIFGQNFDALQITFPFKSFNRSYFEWEISFDMYQFTPTIDQSMEAYLSFSFHTKPKLLKYEVVGSEDSTNYCNNTKISKLKYSSSTFLPNASQTFYLVNEITSPINTFNQHTDKVRGVAFSPDGLNIVSGSLDETIKIYNTLTGDLIREINNINPVGTIAYSKNGLYIASSDYNNCLRVWNASTGALFKTLPSMGYIDFSPDSSSIVSADFKIGTITLWEIASEKKLKTISVSNNTGYWQINFSPNGSLIYTCSKNEVIQIWQTTTGNFVKEFPNYWAFALSRNGSYIVGCISESSDTPLYLLDTSTGNILQTYSYDENKSYVLWVALSPNDDYLVSAESDYALKLWETWTGKLLRTYRGHTDEITQVTFSPNSLYIASASVDKTLKLWKTSPFSLSTYPVQGVGYYGLRNLEISIKPCDQSCEHCAGSASNCLICVQNTIQSTSAGKCTCPNGFYWVSFSITPNTSNLKCIQCPENCILCVENKCFSCKSDYFLTKEGKCVKECPESWFAEGRYCRQCNESCLECTGRTSNNCLKCASNKYLVVDTGSCELCSDHCEACEGTKQCTKCAINYFFNENQLICQENKCVDYCEVCEKLICKKCREGYFFATVNFCQKIKEIFVTLKEISNPSLFAIEFSSFVSFIDENLENILNLFIKSSSKNNIIVGGYKKMSWPKSFKNITNSSYLITPVFNSSLPSGSSLNFQFLINYSDPNSSNFKLIPDNLSAQLYEFTPCESFSEFYSNISHSCINKTIITPQLLNTRNQSVFELRFTNLESIKDFQYLLKNFSTIKIEGYLSSDFTFEIAQTSNSTFSLTMKYLKSIVLAPTLYLIIEIPVFYSLTSNFILEPTKVSINLCDYYIMDDSERNMTNLLVNQTKIISSFGQTLSITATVISGSNSGLQSLLLTYLIQLFEFNYINYPTNLVEVYKNTLPTTKLFYSEIPVAKKDENVLPGDLLFHTISPYFLNNVGENLVRICVVYVIAIIFHQFCRKIKSNSFVMKILRFIRNTFVWQLLFCFIFESLTGFVYYMLMNIIYATISTSAGIFNYCFSFFTILFVIIFLIMIYKIIKKCQNYKTAKKNEKSESKTPTLNKNNKVFPIVSDEDKQLSKDKDVITISESLPTHDKPCLEEIKPKTEVIDLVPKIVDVNMLNTQVKNEYDNLTSSSNSNTKTFKKIEILPQTQPVLISMKIPKRFSQVKLFFGKIGRVLYNQNPEDYSKDFLFLHKTIKDKNYIRYFILLQITLQLIIAIALATMRSCPLAQMIFVNLLFLCYIIITIKSQPFEEKLDFYLELCNEIITQIFFICVLAIAILDLIQNKDTNLRMKFGWVAVGMILSIQYFGCFASLIYILLYCKKKIEELTTYLKKKKEEREKNSLNSKLKKINDK